MQAVANASGIEIEDREPDSFRVVVLARVHGHRQPDSMRGGKFLSVVMRPRFRDFIPSEVDADNAAAVGISPVLRRGHRE